MDAALEGLETIAGGLFVKSVDELLTLAHEMIAAAQPPAPFPLEPEEVMLWLENQFSEGTRAPAQLIAPPIPGPPLGAFRHLFRPPLARTQRMRPTRIAL